MLLLITFIEYFAIYSNVYAGVGFESCNCLITIHNYCNYYLLHVLPN